MRRPEPIPDLDEIRVILEPFGITHIAVADAEPMLRARAEIERRRDLGLSDSMGFTYRDPARSTDPGRAVTGARSVIVAARPYSTAPDTSDESVSEPTCTPIARVARYAWSDHYGPLREGLRTAARRIRRSGHRAVAFADDNSMVDREAAYRAGLGWFGRNANLLIPGAGSFFVLGSIVTTVEYPVGSPVPDGCGSCRRCIDACPTGAIVGDGVIDARRCLAWLVQRPGTFPEEYRVALGDRIYGCDDCQDSCPPTVRLGHRHVAVPFGPEESAVDPAWILDATDHDLLDRLGRWYLAGRDPRWLRRNALLVIGNTATPSDTRCLDAVERFRTGPDPLLAEHADWARRRIDERCRPVTVAAPTRRETR
jgi:epoxyqueuosine reductase